MKKKIIAFAGSTSLNSINLQLVKYASKHILDVEIEILDLNKFEIPIYSIDRENESGFPKEAELFIQKMHQADGIVCSLAEHNASYTAAFKNILDWCSRVNRNIFGDNPMLLMSTSPGGYGGGNVMKQASIFFPKSGAQVVASFSLPKFHEHFKDGEIINAEWEEKILNEIKLFQKSIAK